MLTARACSCQAGRARFPGHRPCQAAVTRRVRPPWAQSPVGGQTGYSARVPVRTGMVNAQP